MISLLQVLRRRAGISSGSLAFVMYRALRSFVTSSTVTVSSDNNISGGG
jgi:hypothetical protein